MGIFSKISRKIGFTETESKIILFLLLTFFIGLIINVLKDEFGYQNLLKFDYAKTDSEFIAAGYEPDSVLSAKKIIKNGFDSKLELLDFSGENFSNNLFTDSSSSSKIIDINTADVRLLSTLKGIGPKTAKAIVDYRLKNGRFDSIKDLMNVRGIGKVKLNNIRKNIIIK